MNRIPIFFLLASCLLIVSCDKNKRSSKRLFKTGTWRAIELTFDANVIEPLPTITFNECDIYDEVCTGTWSTEPGTRVDFAWQVANDGNSLEITTQPFNAADSLLTRSQILAAKQVYELSGLYYFENLTKDQMTIYSQTTEEYGTKYVYIDLVP